MKTVKIITFIFLFILLVYHPTISEELPRFMGVYVKQDSGYIEVPNIKSVFKKYNFQNSPMGKNSDFNVKFTVNRSQFTITSLEEFNKNGFLVKEDKNWSGFTLSRVLHTGKYANNENQQEIIQAVIYGGPMGQPYSTKYLDKKTLPSEWCELRKAKIAEDTYIYVPSKPVEKGFYFIDYSINGKERPGSHQIHIQ